MFPTWRDTWSEVGVPSVSRYLESWQNVAYVHDNRLVSTRVCTKDWWSLRVSKEMNIRCRNSEGATGFLMSSALDSNTKACYLIKRKWWNTVDLLRSGLIFDHLKLRKLFLEIMFRDFLLLSICLTLYDLNWYSMNCAFLFISVSSVCIFLG